MQRRLGLRRWARIKHGVMGFLDAYGLSASLPEKFGEQELPFVQLCSAHNRSIKQFLLSRVVRHGGHHIGFLLRDSSRLFTARCCLLFSLRVNWRL